MAITQDYVSAAGIEGNDYKGATFTDGAFTVADMTLTKTAAFAASKANHYLYLTDNGSGRVTAGYYKIASVTSANAVVLATSPKSGATDPVDVVCTQHAGTALLPWRSLQGAFDLCTRNATDGNQVNLKAGTAQVNAAALDLTTFVIGGALSEAVPLIVRGYTFAANDGGVGEINCGGATLWASETYDYIMHVDLDIHTMGDNAGIYADVGIVVFRCTVHKGASAPAAKHLIRLGNNARVIGCYVYDAGSGGSYGISINNNGLVYGNFVSIGSAQVSGRGINVVADSVVMNNIVICSSTTNGGIFSGIRSMMMGNIAYSTVASTAYGIYLLTTSVIPTVVINNILEGFNGIGGEGINVSSDIGIVGYNAFYNNTATYTIAGESFINLTANDVDLTPLGASPFTSAATGDFSLTTAAKALLRGVGWPAAYLGAHANTDGHITIGPVQYGEAEAASGGGGVRPVRIVPLAGVIGR